MPKTKNKIAFAVIIASVVLITCIPQYGLLALSQTNMVQDLQIAASTAPNFRVGANPSRLYIVVGVTETSVIKVSSVNRFNGTIDLDVDSASGIISKIAPNSVTIKYNQPGYATLSIKAQPKIEPGIYNITITASSGSLSHSVNVTVRVLQPDFILRASPSIVYVVKGTTGTSNISVYSVDRFNGTISLTVSTPIGWTGPTFGKNMLSLNYPKSNSTMLSVTVPTDARTGKYAVTVTGETGNKDKSDELIHSVNVTVQVINPDFRISVNPSTMYLLPGTSQNSIIRVSSVDRFNGTITLTPIIPSPLTGSLLPLSLSIAYNKAESSTLSITVPSSAKTGKYVIPITANSGSLTHSINVTVQVIKPDIAIYSSPSFLSIKAGTSANATIKTLSLGRFNGTVTLTTASPSGWTTTIDTNQLKVMYNQSNSTKVSIAIPTDTEPGKYTVEFTGTSSSLSDSTSIKIVVVP